MHGERRRKKKYMIGPPTSIVMADFRYCWGLTDVHDKDHKWLGNKKKWNTSSGYNRVMTFTLGYKF